MPQIARPPPDIASIVEDAIASSAGPRMFMGTTAVPMRIVSVAAATAEPSAKASLPPTSGTHAES